MFRYKTKHALQGGQLWRSFQDDYELWLDQEALSPSYFSQSKIPAVDKRMLDALKDYALEENTDVRICLHDSPAASFQNMIILHRQSQYYRPHSHSKNGEAYHLIEGELGIPFFDETGEIVERVHLSVNNRIIVRIPIHHIHAMYPLTKFVIFHESKSGPFVPGEDISYPSWAPKTNNEEAIKKYQIRVSKGYC